MIGRPFRTLLQSRYLGDARAFVRTLEQHPERQHYFDRGDLVAARLERLHESNPRTSFELIADESLLWLRVRLYADDRPVDADFPLVLIRQMVEELHLFDAGLDIVTGYRSVRSREQLSLVTRAITDGDRRLPIVLMSEPVDRDLLTAAAQLCGIAHVFRIANRLSHRLVETLGPQWPTHGGAIRTFSVPFPGDREAHPITLGSRRPHPDVFVRRVRWFAVNLARNYPFPCIDALAAAYSAPLPA